MILLLLNLRIGYNSNRGAIMPYADLHIHTNASDGILTPAEVVEWAQKKKLRAISITDHDTVFGIDKALESNKNNNYLEIIPGVELNTDFYGEEIHILGYFIDYNDTNLLNILKKMQQSRYERALKIINKLNNLDINISMDQIKRISEGNSIGRPHIARAMIESGYINNIKSAFDNYIGKGRPAYEERFKLESKKAIEIINKIGGVAVLAHPGLIKNKAIISSLINIGIQGIEVYHTKHDYDTIRYLNNIAKEKKLLITGGTDCHGIMVNNEPILGNVTIDYNKVIKLKNAANRH